MPYPAEPPKRGEIYWLDFNPSRGSEQAGHRPALVISLDGYNKRMPTVVVAALTTALRDPVSPIAVRIAAGDPLAREGTVLAFQVMTVSQDRLENFAGRLSDAKMAEVDSALAVSFGLTRP